MKYFIGVVLIFLGIVLGIYLGVWVFFIGGIVNVVDGAKADPTNGGMIAWGLVEVCILAELVGYGTFLFFTFVGVMCFGEESGHRRWSNSSGNRSIELSWDRRRQEYLNNQED